jgi:pilus assembly protein TadC
MKSILGAIVIVFLATCFLYATAIVVGGWLGVVNYYSAESLNMLKKASEK